MSLTRKIKDNRFIRGLYFGWQRNFGWLNHRKFGYIADNVILTTPPPHHPVWKCKKCIYT